MRRILLASVAMALAASQAACQTFTVTGTTPSGQTLSGEVTVSPAPPPPNVTPIPPIIPLTPPASPEPKPTAPGSPPVTPTPVVITIPDTTPIPPTPPLVCATEPSGGATYYSDPVNGSDTNDGSAAHPFGSLRAIVADGLFASAPKPSKTAAHLIVGGDKLLLMTGDHGSVLIQGNSGVPAHPNLGNGYINSAMVTVEAAPGQTPVLEHFEFLGASKWAVRGLTVTSLNPGPHWLSEPPPVGGTGYGDYDLILLRGSNHDIIIDGNHVASTFADTDGWSTADWRMKRASGIANDGGGVSTCTTITNNDLHNVGFGITSTGGDTTTIAGNSIDHFSDDGMDYGDHHMHIHHNKITNSVEDGDGYHRDAMQGQPPRPYKEDTESHDIEIDHNAVIRITDPNLSHPGALQGIDEFDGQWDNVNVHDNQVTTYAWQGIAYYGGNGVTIKDNVLLRDNGRVQNCVGLTAAQCDATPVTDGNSIPNAPRPEINVVSSKLHIAPVNVVVSGNIATGYGIDQHGANVAVTNNLCVPSGPACLMELPKAGVATWNNKPGTYPGNNVITALTPAQLFKTFDPVALAYDLTLAVPNPVGAP